jgi:hypothetical protein
LRFRFGLVQQFPDVFAEGASSGGLQLASVGRKHFVKCVSGRKDDFGRKAGILLRQLRSQHIFQIMGKLAQLTVAASSGVALERVHSATNVAKLLDVAGPLFEGQTRIVHALKDFLRALKKEIAELRGLLVGRESHWAASIF